MRITYSRRPLAVDPAHMTTLHQEAIEQLELMHTVVEASELALGAIHDTLSNIAEDHWEGYLDVIHMICMHDDNLATVIKKRNFKMRDSEAVDNDRPASGNRPLLLLLLSGLLRRHRRFVCFYGLKANPMGDYIKESVAKEREHVAQIVEMIQNMM